jgi:hypothetical protein
VAEESLRVNPVSSHAPLTKATVLLHRGRHKLVYYRGDGGYDVAYELYDVENDPEEREDLYATGDPIAQEMPEALERRLAEVNRP